jgi:hypothetical protein
MSQTPDTLLSELSERGIAIRCEGDQLLVADPRRALTLDLSAAIRRHKPALLQRLNPQPFDQLPLVATTPSDEPSPAQSAAVPSSLAIEAWPSDPAQRARLSALLIDPRCVEFYAAAAALGEAIDRKEAAAITLAQARFDQALANARALALEVLA